MPGIGAGDGGGAATEMEWDLDVDAFLDDVSAELSCCTFLGTKIHSFARCGWT